MRFKMVHSNIKNAKSELVNLKFVTYAQPIPLSLWKESYGWCASLITSSSNCLQVSLIAWIHWKWSVVENTLEQVFPYYTYEKNVYRDLNHAQNIWKKKVSLTRIFTDFKFWNFELEHIYY